MSIIMFDGMHEVNFDLLEILPRSRSCAFVMKGVVFVELIHFQLGAFLPFVMSMQLVKLSTVFVAARDLDTTHVFLASFA